MSKLLELRAWKLFVAVVLLPFILLIFLSIAREVYYVTQTGSTSPAESGGWVNYLVFVWFGLMVAIPFAWQFQVGTKLAKSLANGRTYADRRFKYAYYIPLVLLGLSVGISQLQMMDDGRLSVSESRVQDVFFILFLVSFLISFYIRYRQLSLTLSWVEAASSRSSRGHVANLFLLFFWPIGIWFLQPYINEAWRNLRERPLFDHFLQP